MAARDIVGRITNRAERVGLVVRPEVATRLRDYLDVLCRWNRKLNLTSLSLEPLTDQAVDRLLIEPLVAVRHVGSKDRAYVDIGSGGGSPAFPIVIASEGLSAVLVESKVRKAAFLREVARQLGLESRVEVFNGRFEELLTRQDLMAAVDVVSLRAVRADDALWRVLVTMMRPGGKVLWFLSEGQSGDLPWSLKLVKTERLGSGAETGQLVVAKKVG